MRRSRITGIAMLILGAAHNLATPYVATRVKALPVLEYRVFVLMFLGTGVAVMLAGATQCVIAGLSKPLTKPAKLGLVLSGVYVTLIGAGAIFITPWNPIAYALCLSGMVGTLPAWRSVS